MYRFFMWVAKFETSRKSSIFEPVCKKNKVTIVAVAISNYKKGDKYYFAGAGSIYGKLDNIKRAINDIKNDKRIKKLEQKKNFFITLFERDKLMKEFYNPEFYHIKPIIIDIQGKETWEIGCFRREPLMRLIQTIKSNEFYFKLLKLKREKLESLTYVSFLPKLTDKQREAIDLAIAHGYYKSPREIDLKSLAKLSKLSFSTYQVHLRKAEEKLIPNLFKSA